MSKMYLRENYLKNYINFNSLTGSKEDMFQYCKNNSFIHENVKFKVFCQLINKGYKVLTEVEFKNKQRADIVAFDKEGNGYIIEIVHSESDESIKNKINTYPIDYELFFIHTSDIQLNNEIALPI